MRNSQIQINVAVPEFVGSQGNGRYGKSIKSEVRKIMRLIFEVNNGKGYLEIDGKRAEFNKVGGEAEINLSELPEETPGKIIAGQLLFNLDAIANADLLSLGKMWEETSDEILDEIYESF